MQNGVSSVLAVLAKEALNLEGGIGRLSKAFEGLNRTSLAVGGGLAILGGTSILYGLKKVTDQAKDLSHELVQIQNLGINPVQFAQAKFAAFGLHGQVPGITSVDALRIYGQTYSPLGHENALKMIQPLAQFVQAVGAVTGNYKGAEDKVYSMVRAGDLMGKFMNSLTHQVDIDKLQHFLDLGARVIQATHGRVGADQWFALAQQGGPALSNMSDKGLLTMAMITQAMGGGRAGTALSSLFTQFQGGIMTKWRAQKLMDLGVLDQNAVESITPGGHIMWRRGLEPGTSPFARAMADDPLKAITILKGAMETHGYPTIEKQVPLLFELFQRQTSIREIHDLLRNLPQLTQERGRIVAGLGTSASANLRNTQDYEQAMHNLDASFHEMMIHIASPLTQAAIPIMNRIGSAFDKIGEFAKAPGNAEIIANVGYGLGILGTALVSAGAVAIFAALGPAGWLAGGLTALGLAALTYKDPILKFISGTWVTSIMDKLNKVQQAITDMLQSVIDWIWKHIPDWIKKINYTGEGFGGSDIIHTSFGGGGGGHSALGGWSGGGGSSVGALSTGERGQYANIIRRVAAEEGVDPNALLKIYGTEGASAWYGDHGKSFGPFQLYTGGGLGNIYSGSKERSAKGVEEQTRFVARYGKAHGEWSSDVWHGLRGHGGSIPFKPYQKQDRPAVIHNTMYLDGEPIHHSVVKRIVRGMTHPTTAPYHDGSRHWTPPDAGLVGV